MAGKTETPKTPQEMGITEEAWDLLSKLEGKAKTIEDAVMKSGKAAGAAISDIVIALWKQIATP